MPTIDSREILVHVPRQQAPRKQFVIAKSWNCLESILKRMDVYIVLQLHDGILHSGENEVSIAVLSNL